MVIYIIILLAMAPHFFLSKLDPSLQTSMNISLAIFPSWQSAMYQLSPELSWVWDPEKDFSSCLCYINILLPYVRSHRVFPFDSNGLWTLHMAICNQLIISSQEPIHVHPSGGWLLTQWNSSPDMAEMPIFLASFYESNHTNHLFFDIHPILKLVCGDIFMNEILVYIVALLFFTVPYLLIIC